MRRREGDRKGERRAFVTHDGLAYVRFVSLCILSEYFKQYFTSLFERLWEMNRLTERRRAKKERVKTPTKY